MFWRGSKFKTTSHQVFFGSWIRCSFRGWLKYYSVIGISFETTNYSENFNDNWTHPPTPFHAFHSHRCAIEIDQQQAAKKIEQRTRLDGDLSPILQPYHSSLVSKETLQYRWIGFLYCWPFPRIERQQACKLCAFANFHLCRSIKNPRPQPR